jgi:hypothetical protein
MNGADMLVWFTHLGEALTEVEFNKRASMRLAGLCPWDMALRLQMWYDLDLSCGFVYF